MPTVEAVLFPQTQVSSALNIVGFIAWALASALLKMPRAAFALALLRAFLSRRKAAGGAAAGKAPARAKAAKDAGSPSQPHYMAPMYHVDAVRARRDARRRRRVERACSERDGTGALVPTAGALPGVRGGPAHDSGEAAHLDAVAAGGGVDAREDHPRAEPGVQAVRRPGRRAAAARPATLLGWMLRFFFWSILCSAFYTYTWQLDPAGRGPGDSRPLEKWQQRRRWTGGTTPSREARL